MPSQEKRILFVVGASYVAGAEITNFNLIRDLHLQGIKVFVVVSGWNDGDFIARLNQFNIPYKAIKLGFIFITKPLWTLDSLVHYPKAILQLRRILKEFKPEWVFHPGYRNYLMGYFLFKKYKNIYREHNDPLLNKINFKLYHFLNQHINHFICPSQQVKNTLIKLGINTNRITIIPSPIDPEFENLSIIDQPLNNTPKIGIIGQIHQNKGFDFLFNELAKVQHDFQFYIYGNDNNEYANMLKTKMPSNIKSKVKWMGYNKNRLDIYMDLDIVLFPSLSESFGRIIIEAGSFGIPVIASAIPSFKELIIHGKTGLLFDLKKTSELPILLESVINNTKLREELGNNARTFVLANFTSEKCTEKFKNIIYE